MKKTKRKGFNFFRSYYDVFNELSDEDKLAFIEALLDKQFLGINPTDLKGLAKFAWISQVNSIDSQVKGYEDKTGVKLTPTVGGSERVENTPTEQVQVEVEEKGKVQGVFSPEQFLSWFNDSRTKLLQKPSNSNYLSGVDKNYLEILTNRYKGEDFGKAFHNLCNDKWANESNQIIPKHFLKPENFDKYLQIEQKPLLTKKQKINRGWAV
tara:strand:+ start:4677 stop:5306 length:630 start_codon:yes stop_codon:yes gene_type:complete